MLGLIVWACGMISAQLEGLAEIECFVSSFIVTCIACLLDKYVYNGELCLYGQLFGGIVWYKHNDNCCGKLTLLTIMLLGYCPESLLL